MLLTAYRYISKELLIPFVMGVVVATFILIMFQILRLTEFIVVHGVQFSIIVKLFYYLVVAFLPVTIPVSFLFSVLLVFNRLSGDSEITAFKAAGISIYQLMIPVNMVSMLALLATFYVSYYEAPWGNRKFENTLHKIGSARATMQLREGFFNEGFFNGFMIYPEKIDPRTNRMSNVFIYDERDKTLPVSIMAKNSRLEVDQKTKKTMLYLNKGSMVFLNNTGEKYKNAKFDKYRIRLYDGDRVGEKKLTPPSMSSGEILKTIKKAAKKKDKRWYSKLLVEYHRRLSIPFACIIFGFLGIGFGNMSRRNVKAGAGLISFVVMLLYWVIYIGGTSFGSKGKINPVLSVWMANIIFIFVSVYLIRRKA
ncbi:MAG: LPS export ABC transporter permease LptF [Oligoflexia bacterium]|nr:LPS export ABC transporter permease LptF [Oligoflexia bacterium]